MKPNWAPIVGPAGKALDDIKTILSGGGTFKDNMLAAEVEIDLVHGVAKNWKNPGFAPTGFLYLDSIDPDGTRLQLDGPPVFDPRPLGGDGKVKRDHFSLTARYASPVEVVSATLAYTSATALVTDTPKNVTSISLTPGIWDVYGHVGFSGTPTGTTLLGAIDTASAGTGTPGYSRVDLPTMPNASSFSGVTIPPVPLTLTAAATAYLVAYCVFSASAISAFGSIRARRVDVDPATTATVRGILVGG